MWGSDVAQAAMDDIVASVQKVKTSAGVAQRVLRLLQSPDFDVKQVVRVLETDPALATQILTLVNSSYFGLPRRVASLQHAVACLGAHTLRLALLNYGVMQCLATVLPAKRREEFLCRSLTVAVAADQLTRTHGCGNPEEAYCAGLIVDVGVLALAQAAKTRYEPLLESHAMGDALLAAEMAEFGFNHAELGAHLLVQWSLPPQICEAVALHHRHPCDGNTLATTVQTACLVAEAIWSPTSDAVPQARSALQDHFEFNTDDFIQLATDCKAWLEEHAGTMNLHLRTEIDVEQLRLQATERFVAESVAAALELDGLQALAGENYPQM